METKDLKTSFSCDISILSRPPKLRHNQPPLFICNIVVPWMLRLLKLVGSGGVRLTHLIVLKVIALLWTSTDTHL